MAKLNLQARNCEVNEELQAHIEEKIDGLERLLAHSDDAIVRLSCERGRHSAEITLLTDGMITRGEERAANLRQAFDNAVDKLEGQLRRYKKKVLARDRRHDNRDDVAGSILHAKLQTAGIAADGVSPSASAAFATYVEPDGTTNEDHEDSVVRVKRFALKPMSAEFTGQANNVFIRLV
jgi:putative sigma-54 modulation protein